EKTVAAISLLDKGGIPSLVATEGNGFGNVLVLNSRPTIGIYSKNLMQPTLELNYVTVNQTPTALKDTWNSALSKTSLKYGDVISLSVNKRTVSNENLMGSKTAVSKSEVLVKETEGYPVAFYEITKTGYSLLNINQLKVSEQTILEGTSESELDKNIDQYISTTGFDKIKPVKFVKYPDTSKAGSSEAVIQVEESLTSGGVATYEYTVPFKIDRRNVAPSANGVTQKINIGETLKDRLPENALDVLTNISDDFDKPEDLKATYETLPAADVVGGTEVTVKLEDSEGASTLVKVPVDVQWGST
ncbi:hypothetical protein LT174_002742, partial [Enterococcus faecalis]|nr:hypothetical protein [Enterococcus faecalis]